MLRLTEGPTARSGSPDDIEGEHPQQGGKLQAELSGKDKKMTEKWELKEGFFHRGQEPLFHNQVRVFGQMPILFSDEVEAAIRNKKSNI